MSQSPSIHEKERSVSSLTGPVSSAEELVASYHKISDDLGMKPNPSVMHILKYQQDLSTISLARNYYGEKGLNAILPTIRNTRVMVLDLKDTLLTYENICVLTKEFTQHPTLTSVDLTGNQLSVQSARKLLEWVQQCNNIRELHIDPGTPRFLFIQKQCMANRNVLIDVCACLLCAKHLLNPVENAETMFLVRLSEAIEQHNMELTSSEFHFLFRVVRCALRNNEGVLVFCSRPCIVQFVSDVFDVFRNPLLEPRNNVLRTAWEGFNFKEEISLTPMTTQVPKPPPRGQSDWIKCDFCCRNGKNVPWVFNALLKLLPHEVSLASEDGSGKTVLRPSVFVKLVSRLYEVKNLSLCSRRCCKWLLRSALIGGGGLLTYVSDSADLALHEDVPGLRVPPDEAEFSLVDITIPNSKDHGESDMSVAYVMASLCEDLEGVPIDHNFCFATARVIGKKKVYHWGVELRDACKAATTYGVLPASLAPFQDGSRDEVADWYNWTQTPNLDALMKSAISHRKPYFFNVCGPFDNMFDNIRAALWAFRTTNRSVLCGAKWRPPWVRSPGGVIPTDRAKGGIGMAVKIVGQRVINGEPYLVIDPCMGPRRGHRGYFYANRTVINRHFLYGAYVFKEKSAIVHRSLTSTEHQLGIARLDPSTRYILENPKLAEEALMFLASPKYRQEFYTVHDRFQASLSSMPLEALFMYRGPNYSHTSHDTRVLSHLVHAYRGSFQSQVAFFWSNKAPKNVCRWFCELLNVLEQICSEVKETQEAESAAARRKSSQARKASDSADGTLPSGESHAPVPRKPQSQRQSSSGRSKDLTTDGSTFPRKGSQRNCMALSRISDKSTQWLESCKEVIARGQKAILSSRFSIACVALNRVHARGKGVSPLLYFVCAGHVLEYDMELSMPVQDPIPVKDHRTFMNFTFTEGLECIIYHDVFTSPIAYCFAGSVWIKWDAARGVILDGPLSTKDYPPLPKLPPPFCDKIDAGVNVTSSDATILFSGPNYLEYNMKTLEILSGPEPLGTNAFESLPTTFHQGIQNAVLHHVNPHLCYLMSGEDVLLWNLSTKSIDQEAYPVSMIFPNLPRPLFSHSVADLMSHLSRSMLNQLPTARIGNVVPREGDVKVSPCSRCTLIADSVNRLCCFKVDGPLGVLRVPEGGSAVVDFDFAGTGNDSPLGYVHIMSDYGFFVAPHEVSASAQILSSNDTLSWVPQGTVTLNKCVVPRWWSEASYFRFWRISFQNVPKNFTLHRVLWFVATWVPQHSPFEFIVPADLCSATGCKIDIAAPRLLSNADLLVSGGPSPTQPVACYPSGTLWQPKHAVIPLSGDTCLFTVGNCFLEWNFRECRPVNMSSYSLGTHPSFGRLPAPFSVIGFDCAAVRDVRYGQEVYLFCDDSFILWDYERCAPHGPVRRLSDQGSDFSKLPQPFCNGVDAALSIARGELTETYFFRGELYLVWSMRDREVVEGPYHYKHGVMQDGFPEDLLRPGESLHAVLQSPVAPKTRLYFVGNRWIEDTVSAGSKEIRGPFSVRNVQGFSRLVSEMEWSTARRQGHFRFDLGNKPKMFCDCRMYTTVGVDAKSKWLVQWSDDALSWTTITTHVQSEGWCRSNWRLEDVKFVSHRYWQLVAVDGGSPGSSVTYNAVQWGVLPSALVMDHPRVGEGTTAVISSNMLQEFSFPNSKARSQRTIVLDFGQNHSIDLVGLSLELNMNTVELLTWSVLCGASLDSLEEVAQFIMQSKRVECWWAPTLARRYWKLELQGGVVGADVTYSFTNLTLYEYAGPSIYRSDCLVSRREYVDSITVLQNPTSKAAIQLTNSRVGTMIDFNCKGQAVPFTMLEVFTLDRGSSITDWDIMCSSDGLEWTSVSRVSQSSEHCTSWWLHAGSFPLWRLQCTGQFGGGWPKIERVVWSVSKGELHSHYPQLTLLNSTTKVPPLSPSLSVAGNPLDVVYTAENGGKIALIKCIVVTSISAAAKISVDCFVQGKWYTVTIYEMNPAYTSHVITWSYSGPHERWRLHVVDQSEAFSILTFTSSLQNVKWYTATHIAHTLAEIQHTTTLCLGQKSLPAVFGAGTFPHLLRWNFTHPATFGKIQVTQLSSQGAVLGTPHEWTLHASIDGSTGWFKVCTHVQYRDVSSTRFTAPYPCKGWQMTCYSTTPQTVTNVEWFTPTAVGAVAMGENASDLVDNVNAEEVSALLSAQDEGQSRLKIQRPMAEKANVGDPNLEAIASAPAAKTPATGAIVESNTNLAAPLNSFQDAYPEVHGAALQSVKDFQKVVLKYLKDTSSTKNAVGIELHKCLTEKFAGTALALLVDVLPQFSMKDIKVGKEQASPLNILPKIDFRGSMFGDVMGFQNMLCVWSVRWPSMPPGLAHINKSTMAIEAERVAGLSAMKMLETVTSFLVLEFKETTSKKKEEKDIDWQPERVFPNFGMALSKTQSDSIKLTLRRSMFVVSTGPYWFGTRAPYQHLPVSSSCPIDIPYPLCLEKGINLVSQFDPAICQGTPWAIMSSLGIKNNCPVNVSFPNQNAHSCHVAFCAPIEGNLGVPNMKWNPVCMHLGWSGGGWTSMYWNGTATYTILDTTVSLSLRADVRLSKNTIGIGGRCDVDTIPNLCGLRGCLLQDITMSIVLQILPDKNHQIMCREASLSGILNIAGNLDVQARVIVTNPTRPRLRCEAKTLNLRSLVGFSKHLCSSNLIAEEWLYAHHLQMIDCEVQFDSSGRQVSILGRVCIFDVEGKASAQLCQAGGIHVSGKLPELALGSLWCKPLADSVGFELHIDEKSCHIEIFTTVQLTALITFPAVLRISEQGCKAEVEHTPPGIPWMCLHLSLFCENVFSQEFIVSGSIEKKAAEEALHHALMEIPVVNEVVSIGLDFSFKLNHVTMIPFSLSCPNLSLRFVGVFLGSDFNIVAVVNAENINTFLPVVASIIVENCSCVVRNIWDEFVVKERNDRVVEESFLNHKTKGWTELVVPTSIGITAGHEKSQSGDAFGGSKANRKE